MPYGITKTSYLPPSRGSISRPYSGRCYGRYSIFPPFKDEWLSRPASTQVNDLLRVAIQVYPIPGASWLSRPSAPLDEYQP